MMTRTITLVLGEDGNPVSHPTIYDISRDEHRAVTQNDIDDLLRFKAAFFDIVGVVKKNERGHG